MRVLLRLPGEGAGQLDQVDVFDRQQSQHKSRDKPDAGFVSR
ncbi:MAG: hypothetical protein U0Z53_31185 [Blastocatellia bacterium]